MGCHTWFYVYQKEKQQEWADEWRAFKLKALNKYISHIKKLNSSEVRKRLNEWGRQYPNSGVENFTVEQFKEACLQEPLQTKKMFDDNLDTVHIMGNCEQIDTVCDYGLYMIHDGKIYREMGAHHTDGTNVFPESIGDLFRIYDYEAEDCYSIDDCYLRCAEHDVILTDEQDAELKWFWKTYPDSIVVFG